MARRPKDLSWPADPEPLPVPVVDNHTHLETVLALTDDSGWAQDARAAEEVGADVRADEAVDRLGPHLARAAAAGVDRMVQVGCDLGSIAWTDVLVRRCPALLGAVAIHPNEAVLHAGVHEVAPDGLDPSPAPRHEVPLDEALAEVARVARVNDRVRAIGETGLDHFRAGPRGREVQREAFRAHVALAKELGLALQIHDREAHEEVVEVLEADGAPERTVFHCFSGDLPLAELCGERGWYVSVAGPVTFAANNALRAAVGAVPPRLLLVETDAPYLTPHPYRGRPNAPYLAALTVRRLAEELDADLAELCHRLAATSEQVYGPWASPS